MHSNTHRIFNITEFKPTPSTFYEFSLSPRFSGKSSSAHAYGPEFDAHVSGRGRADVVALYHMYITVRTLHDNYSIYTVHDNYKLQSCMVGFRMMSTFDSCQLPSLEEHLITAYDL